MTAQLWFIPPDDWPAAVALTVNLLHQISTFPLFFLKSFFLSYQVFFSTLSALPPVLLDRKYSRRCGVVVDLRPWQTPSIRLICIHKSIGYLTLANILGSRKRRCWVGRVTLSLVMELWWSVTAPHGCWLSVWGNAL